VSRWRIVNAFRHDGFAMDRNARVDAMNSGGAQCKTAVEGECIQRAKNRDTRDTETEYCEPIALVSKTLTSRN
jgi:hypothetical protein